MFISQKTISYAIFNLQGSANHLLKIWLVLKYMGFKKDQNVEIDTSNSTPALQRLFDFGSPDKSYFIPFAHSKRFAFMKCDASRSIIQTNIQRWATSDSVVTCNPSSYLSISVQTDNKLLVKAGRNYPVGLGNGKNGFALEDDQKVHVPAEAFAIWLFSRSEIEEKKTDDLVQDMKELLNLSNEEYKLIFYSKPIQIEYAERPITDEELYLTCKKSFDTKPNICVEVETKEQYLKKIARMITMSDNPAWISADPCSQLKELLQNGEKAFLLTGPPRTGKTRAIDQFISRNDPDRVTIQMHEGWGYENLVLGLFPGDEDSRSFKWKDGAFLKALKSKKKYIVIEEINRTNISQALGELFSLLEAEYRGENNSILLPNGEQIYIPLDTTIIMTMNTVYTSTEDVDDALIGRVASVYFPPRIEDLNSILAGNHIHSSEGENIKEIFNVIQSSYPLGHGYFAGYKQGGDFKQYYLAHIRPVLLNHFSSYRPETVYQVDNAVDNLF